VTLEGPLEPDTAWSRLPPLSSLCLFACCGIEFTDAHVDDDLVFGSKLLLALALDVDVGFGDPALAQKEVLFHTVPFLLIEHAFGERVERRACLHGEVGDDEAFVVQRQVVVHRLG